MKAKWTEHRGDKKRLPIHACQTKQRPYLTATMKKQTNADPVCLPVFKTGSLKYRNRLKNEEIHKPRLKKNRREKKGMREKKLHSGR